MSKPRIRFRGFDSHWERNKLKDYLTIREDIAENNFTKEDVLSVSGDYGVVNQIAFQGRSYAGQSISNYRVVNKGNVVYTKSPLKANPYGIVKTAKNEEGIVSPLYAVYDTKDNCDPDFVQTYFDDADRLNLYLRRLVNKGAKNTLLISDEGALQGEVVFPIKDEQEKIGGYFGEIDSLLYNVQNKITRLNSLKICYLTRMFPIGGGTEPPMRLKNFHEGWEIIRLKDVAEKVTEKNTLREINEVFTNSAVHGIISQRDYFDHDVAKKDNIQGYYIVSEDDFVYNPRISVTSPVGPINRNKTGKKGVISPLYLVFKVHGINKSYLEYYFKTTNWHEYMRFNGNTGARFDRFSISDEDFFNMPIPVPKSPLEQEKLANYFRNVDELIYLHTQELERLKTLKTSCLEGMFVNP